MKKLMEALKEIELQRKIKILYACETGSRAWGFPSPDSDYDVRFIYMHEKDWYLQLGQQKDSVETMNGELDITGWDLRKSLMLLKKSNTALIERFQSPVRYFEQPGFRDEFCKMVKQYYSPTAVYFHHYSLAVKFWNDLKGKPSFKLKSYFYLLRSLLSCNWIVKDSDVLPMHIEGVMRYIDEDRTEMIRDLIELKAGLGESYEHPADKDLLELITDLFEAVSDKGNNLPVCRQDYRLLNQFFIKQLYATDNK